MVSIRGYSRNSGSGFWPLTTAALVVLCGTGALTWAPRAALATNGVDLDSLPDLDDDQFWSAYKASIPYQDYVRLGQDAADYVDRYGPRKLPGEHDTLFRFRRFLRIQKELDKRLLLYYEMNAAATQAQQREYNDEDRELQKLSHQLHANPPHPPNQQQQLQHHRFGQYELAYPNQQMLDDVRPYPHEEDTLRHLNGNDFSFDHGEHMDEDAQGQHGHHMDVKGTEETGSGGRGRGETWEETEGQGVFGYAPPDPRFYDATDQKDHRTYTSTPTTPPQQRPRPDTFPLVPPRHTERTASTDTNSKSPISPKAMQLQNNKHDRKSAGDDEWPNDAGITTSNRQMVMVQQRNNNNGNEDEERKLKNGDDVFRFNMVGKWLAFGTGIGEELAIGIPTAEIIDGGDTLQVRPVQQHVVHRFGAGASAGVYIIAIVAGISAAAAVGLIAFGIGWYNLQKHVKGTSDAEYPAYGVTGPNKELSPSGDRRLAQSAQMYHYQHQKQQIIAMESRAAAGERHGSISQADSDEENEEGDYTVYECPGLAPTGEMEVKNPMFNDEPTPAQTPQVKTDQPQI